MKANITNKCHNIFKNYQSIDFNKSSAKYFYYNSSIRNTTDIGYIIAGRSFIKLKPNK